MEEISKRLTELEIPSVLKQTAESKYIKFYFERLIDNIQTWNSVVLEFFSFEESHQEIPSTPLTQKQRAMVQLLNILYLTEAGLSGIINLIAFALIQTGHNGLCKRVKGKSISKFDEILKISLSRKLEFLRKNGFGLISDFCLGARDLRNEVAHQNFAIDDIGTVYTFNKGRECRYSFYQITQVSSSIGSFVNELAFKLGEMFNQE